MSATSSRSFVVESVDTPTVRVTDDNFIEVRRFVPAADLGDKLWVAADVTEEGKVVSASVHILSKPQPSAEGAGARERSAEAAPLDPRSAARLIREIDGFACEALRHVSLTETEAVAAPASSTEAAASHADAPDLSDAPAAAPVARAGDAAPTPAGQSSERRAPSSLAAEARTPVGQSNEQFLLAKLEDFVGSAAFTTSVRTFAAEHAHRFKPIVSGDDEHPLHYQELYLQYERLLEASLEAFLTEHGSSVTALVACVRRAQERGEPLASVELLLATTDYEAFLELMLDYVRERRDPTRRPRPPQRALAAADSCGRPSSLCGAEI
jgi:hypothetical protein